MPHRHTFRGLKLLLVTIVGLAFSMAAVAQMGQPRAQPQPNALEREYIEIQQRLMRAQQKAVENTPALQDQAEALEELVTRKMRDSGYDVGGIMETMLATQAKMEEATTDAQRREIMESREVREAQRQMQEAQQAALQDAEVQAAQRAFEEDMLSAIRREEPETDRLIERLQEIQRQAQAGRR